MAQNGTSTKGWMKNEKKNEEKKNEGRKGKDLCGVEGGFFGGVER